MGYCYYGNYAQYFEVGRVEALRSLGISYKELEDKGVMLPVSHYSVNYKAPALYDEELEITTIISEVRGPRVTFDYTIQNKSGKIIADATTTLVFVLKETMRPTAPPSFFMELIQNFEDSSE
jgi:acyl-CoA thioester hydrolase